MSQGNFLKSTLSKAAFNVNKRYKKPDHFQNPEPVLNEVHSLMDQGRYEDAIAVIDEQRKKNYAVDRYPKLLIAEGVALIAIGHADRAMKALINAELVYEERLENDKENEDWLRNLSSVKTNIAVCHILQEDYKSAEKSALSARKLSCNWHGPHINLFTSYLRLNDTESLEMAIEEMLISWPEWNSDTAMMSHLSGDNDLIPDTDLVGLVDKIEEKRG